MAAHASASTRLRVVPTRAHPGFIELFLDRAATSANAVAIEMTGAGGALTYAELRARMERFRGALRELGVGEGDRVLLMLPSGPDLVASFFAIASLAAIAVPVSDALTAFELAPILADAKPVGAIVREPVHSTVGRFASVRFVLTTHGGEGATCATDADTRVISLEELDARPSPIVAPFGDPVVSCHFTYKGLGYPLGALHRYSSYAACLAGVTARYADSASGAHLVLLPMHPVYSLVGAVMMPLSLGARLVIPSRVDRTDVHDLLARHQVRFACLVPLLFRALVARGKKLGKTQARAALHPDLELISGGSFLPEDLSEEVFEAIGVEPRQGYGLTETLPVTSSHAAATRRGTLGVPVHADVTVAIVDAEGRDVPRRRIGEIVVSGPTVTEELIGRPRETQRFIRDGRFHTGDLGSLDGDGFLRFHGRALALTKCASQMVDLQEIELLLKRHPKVAAVRASVSVEPQVGERIAVALVTKKGASMSTDEVLSFARAHLSKHKVPRRVSFHQKDLIVDGGAR